MAGVVKERTFQMSYNHQFVELEERVVKRYAKTNNSILTGYRLDPYRPENRITWLLSSPNNLFKVIWEDGQPPKLIRTGFSYDEVIELYSDAEVRLFERLNRAAIESGALKVHNSPAPAVDTTNLMTDEEIDAIAKTKQLPSITKKISTITSVYTLQRILEAVQKYDRPFSIIKAVEKRINELSTNN